MAKNRLANHLFLEYRVLVDNELGVYNNLHTTFPGAAFPKHAARVWRFAMLAHIWGTMATKLCGGRVDYIEEWRSGR